MIEKYRTKMFYNQSEIFLEVKFFSITSSASMLSVRTVLLYTNLYEVRKRLENLKGGCGWRNKKGNNSRIWELGDTFLIS